MSFLSDCFPKSLQKLKITGSRYLEFPEQQQQKYDLIELQIYSSCDSLTSLSLDAFPNLKNLEIHWCENVESVSLSQPPHPALQYLSIIGCPKFVSFPGEGLAAPNLTRLHVERCSELKALPSDMSTLLPNLESLEMQNCQDICRFPEGGLPAKLKELHVKGCKHLRGLSWIGNLDSLTHLTIDAFECESIIKSYPEVDSLPHLPSLITLEILWFVNLETLECNQLLCLTSLQRLRIKCCRKLENIAGEKLPSSLLRLEIEGCRLLAQRCKQKHEQIWPKISHIPTIQVDFLQIV
ncbi:Putative disease resistance protein [Arachis hypogaea]|nr:Putative disease resistance protein [Arachis hypogaea]